MYEVPKVPVLWPWSVSVRHLMKGMEGEGRRGRGNQAAGTARTMGATLGAGLATTIPVLKYPTHGCEWGFALL